MSHGAPKGFSGLREFVSDVGDDTVSDNLVTTSLHSSHDSKKLSATEGESLTGTGPSYGAGEENGLEAPLGKNSDVKTDDKKNGSGKGVFREYGYEILIAVSLLFVILYYASVSTNNQSGRSTNTRPAASQPSYQVEEEASGSRSQVDNLPVSELALAPEDLTYREPVPGDNNILSMQELRWCARESISIDTIRPHLDTKDLVEMFNSVVAHYNQRCGSFRYRNNNYQVAVKQVEGVRAFVEDSALTTLFLERGLSDESATGQGNATQSEILEAQRLLSKLGYSVGPIDGIFGPQTRQAISSYFSDMGLEHLDPVVTQTLLVWLRRDAR
jgi:hypothetical protein